MTRLTRAAALHEATIVLRIAGVEGPRSDAERLLCHVLQICRTSLIAYPDIELGSDDLIQFNRKVTRRAAREPLPYILGGHPFLDFDVRVGPGALIPRPETELLVEAVSDFILSSHPPPADSSDSTPLRVVDVGTGTGAVAIGLALRHPNLQALATDISSQALEIARRNIEQLGVKDRIHLLEADLLPSSVPDSRVMHDLTGWMGCATAIVSNPPYIPTDQIDDLQPEVALFEPRLALDGGPDGLQIIIRLIHEARQWLKPGGLLAFEVGAGQSRAAVQLVWEAGYQECRTYNDLAGIQRVLTGIWAGG